MAWRELVPTLKIHFVGANLYIPNDDYTKLMVVLPNATRLGTSPDRVADGSRPSRHWPVLFEEREFDTRTHYTVPAHFLGSRLRFDFGVTPSLDLDVIKPHASLGWFAAHPDVLKTPPGDSIAAQILVTAGTVSIYKPPLSGSCNTEWSPKSPNAYGESLAPVIRGLTLTVENATKLDASAETWLTDPDTGAPMGTRVIFSRSLSEDAQFFVGNQCAEDILRWDRNSVNGRAVDPDFRWLFGSSTNSSVASYLMKYLSLPALEVEGSKVDAGATVNDAFARVWKGGGAVGCECQGCVDKKQQY